MSPAMRGAMNGSNESLYMQIPPHYFPIPTTDLSDYLLGVASQQSSLTQQYMQQQTLYQSARQYPIPWTDSCLNAMASSYPGVDADKFVEFGSHA